MLATLIRQVCLFLVLLTATTFATESATITGPIFGTSYTIKVVDDSVNQNDLESAIRQRLAEVDQRMSTWRDDSDVSRFNASASTDWFQVHAETAHVVRLAIDISQQSDGYFDITVAPVVRLWNFGAAAESGFTLPTDAQIAETQLTVGYDKLTARTNPPALRKSLGQLEIDLSAIAKGYAVDSVSELLQRESIERFMIEIGGEVAAQGTNEAGNVWRIGLETPSRGLRQVESVIPLTNQSLATSGDYRNFFEHEGSIYSHTIDPRTARPVIHDLAAVSVIADNCARADALATAILAMGPERGRRWAEEHQISAMLTIRTGTRFTRAKVGHFPLGDVTASSTGGSLFRMFLVTLLVFGVAFIAMSVGTIIAKRRLQGSCGGMAGLTDMEGKSVCDMCTSPAPDCDGKPKVEPELDA